MRPESPVIDFHAHTGRFDRFGWIDDPLRMVDAMDDVGIQITCVFNIFFSDCVTGNEATARFVAARPERFRGFAFASPLAGEAITPELERAVDSLGFVGIKVYPPSTPWPLDDRRWDRIYGFAHERRLPILFHTGVERNSHPYRLASVAQRFPAAILVAGHSGNVAPMRRQALQVAADYSNVYLETCSTYRTPGVIEQLVADAGADRVLFGSDSPLMDPRVQIGKIVTADISAEQKQLVLGQNAARLLGMSADGTR